VRLSAVGDYVMWTVSAQRDRFPEPDAALAGMSAAALHAVACGAIRSWHPDLRALLDNAAVEETLLGVVYVYTRAALAVVDERLDIVVEVTGHPFLASHRLLAGDGRGRLLWYAGRTRTLVLTDPDELDPAALETSLDTLAAAARPQRRKR
jgi:hypothetical protein